ncbi:hypothetical protein MUK42_33709 [Musa troglodytarum]|uniref:Uncharacterized protein n=1 Tax=Musa troglodytarum TaxID=320322 RepID=A0A9E7E7Y3_9LILI|nr:hypothetical protein MUK42_33709 [Musa troglodytarum]
MKISNDKNKSSKLDVNPIGASEVCQEGNNDLVSPFRPWWEGILIYFQAKIFHESDSSVLSWNRSFSGWHGREPFRVLMPINFST